MIELKKVNNTGKEIGPTNPTLDELKADPLTGRFFEAARTLCDVLDSVTVHMAGMEITFKKVQA